VDISIILITYNHKNFILQAIDSVVTQEFKGSLELIIGDDSSTDGTSDLINEYINKYTGAIHIKHLRSESNCGATNNIIQSLEACSGKYVAYLEGDDYWTSIHKIQTQYTFLEDQKQYSAHAHQTTRVNSDAEYKSFKLIKDRIIGAENMDDFHTIAMSSLFMRNYFQSGIPEYVRNFALDQNIIYFLTSQGPIYQSTDILSSYRVHETGAWSGKSTSEKIQSRMEYFNYQLDKLPLKAFQKKTVQNMALNSHLDHVKIWKWKSLFSKDGRKALKELFLFCKRESTYPSIKQLYRALF
jgi:glycosyltransferase involved in cell wall biosynthesis